MSTQAPPATGVLVSIAEELAAIRADGQLRVRTIVEGRAGRTVRIAVGGPKATLCNWAGNDYLGLTHDVRTRNAAARELRRCGSGAGAARLLGGGLRLHRRFELAVAAWLGREDALLTSTGYQANVALLGAVANSNEDVVILDRLAHASLYDGAQLCAGSMLRFTHNDVADLQRQLVRSATARRRVVCVESIYSMDGDQAPLAAIAELCRAHDALLIVDEAHALGVFGAHGRGLCAELGVTPDVIVGTCSKALAAQGGFIAAASAVIELIVNRGRAFLFTTAPAPAAVGAALAALAALQSQPDPGAAVRALAVHIRDSLRAQGWTIPDGRSLIIPVVVGDADAALALAAGLRARGHFAPAIRPPTVPAGGCRIRLTVTAHHRPKDAKQLLAAMALMRQEDAMTVPH